MYKADPNAFFAELWAAAEEEAAEQKNASMANDQPHPHHQTRGRAAIRELNDTPNFFWGCEQY